VAPVCGAHRDVRAATRRGLEPSWCLAQPVHGAGTRTFVIIICTNSNSGADSGGRVTTTRDIFGTANINKKGAPHGQGYEQLFVPRSTHIRWGGRARARTTTSCIRAPRTVHRTVNTHTHTHTRNLSARVCVFNSRCAGSTRATGRKIDHLHTAGHGNMRIGFGHTRARCCGADVGLCTFGLCRGR